MIAAGAVVVDRRGRVLLIRRAHPPLAGEWTLPGGRVEANESPEEAIVRELREEASIETCIVAPLGVADVVGDGFAYSIHEYLVAPLDDASPRAGDDAADVRWAERTELEALGVGADAIAVIDRGLALLTPGAGKALPGR
jgi:8-oxo-dGTP diphosphatase